MILSPVTSPLWPSLLAVLAYGVAAILPERKTPIDEAPRHVLRPAPNVTVWVALTLAWLAHAAAILGSSIGRVGEQLVANFGFALALSVTAWLVLGIYALESRRQGIPAHLRRSLALLAALSVVLCWVFPGRAHPDLSAPWAPLHWILGVASYGLMGVAILHAALLQHAEQSMRAPKPSRLKAPPKLRFPPQDTLPGTPLLRLESLTFRFVAAGFALLTLTLLLGMGTARPWQWDHKAVFSILAWLVFAILLIGRHRFGWRGRMAVRWLYAGTGLLLLAYVGSRFVLEVVLKRGTLPGV